MGLPLVTVLACLGELVLLERLVLEFGDRLPEVVRRLTQLTSETAETMTQRWGISPLPDQLWGIPLAVDQFWRIAIISVVVLLLLAVLGIVRGTTRRLLAATYTSSRRFRERRAATLRRLEHLSKLRHAEIQDTQEDLPGSRVGA